MSSPEVRAELIQAWQAISPNLPYVATINEFVAPSTTTGPVWGTFVFDVISRLDQTMGSHPWIEEQGTATIVLMAQSGTGDDYVASVAGNLVRAWTMWINSAQDLWISSVEAPRPPDPEAVGDAYRLTVVLNYRYQTRGGK